MRSTAFALESLEAARRIGIEVDEAVLARGRAFLGARIDTDGLRPRVQAETRLDELEQMIADSKTHWTALPEKQRKALELENLKDFREWLGTERGDLRKALRGGPKATGAVSFDESDTTWHTVYLTWEGDRDPVKYSEELVARCLRTHVRQRERAGQKNLDELGKLMLDRCLAEMPEPGELVKGIPLDGRKDERRQLPLGFWLAADPVLLSPLVSRRDRNAWRGALEATLPLLLDRRGCQQGSLPPARVVNGFHLGRAGATALTVLVAQGALE